MVCIIRYSHLAEERNMKSLNLWAVWAHTYLPVILLKMHGPESKVFGILSAGKSHGLAPIALSHPAVTNLSLKDMAVLWILVSAFIYNVIYCIIYFDDK